MKFFTVIQIFIMLRRACHHVRRAYWARQPLPPCTSYKHYSGHFMWRRQQQLVRDLNLDPRGYNSVGSSRQTLLNYTAMKFKKDLDVPGVWHPLKRARSDSGVGIGQDHERVVNQELLKQKRQRERELAFAKLREQLGPSATKQRLHH